MVALSYQGVKLGPGLAWEFRVDSEDHYVQVQAMTDPPMGRVNRSPKQRVPVAPQNGDLSLQFFYFKNVDIHYGNHKFFAIIIVKQESP